MAKLGPISYQDVLVRYPEQVTDLLARLRTGRSVQKHAEPERVSWYFEWAILIDPSMLASTAEVEAQVADRVERTRVSIYATVGKWWGMSGPIPVPPELVEYHRGKVEEEKARRIQVMAMTPEERQAEIDQLVGKLADKPGFMALYVPGSK